MTCDCDACEALNTRYASDPDLLAFYRRRLLVRGWAGDADAVEKAYSQAHAEWARGAAERGRARFAVMGVGSRKPLTQTPSDSAEVSEQVEPFVVDMSALKVGVPA